MAQNSLALTVAQSTRAIKHTHTHMQHQYQNTDIIYASLQIGRQMIQSSDHHIRLTNKVKLTVDGRESQTSIMQLAMRHVVMEHLQFSLHILYPCPRVIREKQMKSITCHIAEMEPVETFMTRPNRWPVCLTGRSTGKICKFLTGT